MNRLHHFHLLILHDMNLKVLVPLTRIFLTGLIESHQETFLIMVLPDMFQMKVHQDIPKMMILLPDMFQMKVHQDISKTMILI